MIISNDIMLPRVVYKIVTKVNWATFIKSGLKETKGFGNDLTDGFKHLSTHEQLHPTFINKFKANSLLKTKNKFKLIAVDLDLSVGVKWEPDKNGLIYPHLYSTLVLGHNVLWVLNLEKYQFDKNGI